MARSVIRMLSRVQVFQVNALDFQNWRVVFVSLWCWHFDSICCCNCFRSSRITFGDQTIEYFQLYIDTRKCRKNPPPTLDILQKSHLLSTYGVYTYHEIAQFMSRWNRRNKRNLSTSIVCERIISRGETELIVDIFAVIVVVFFHEMDQMIDENPWKMLQAMTIIPIAYSSIVSLAFPNNLPISFPLPSPLHILL